MQAIDLSQIYQTTALKLYLTPFLLIFLSTPVLASLTNSTAINFNYSVEPLICSNFVVTSSPDSIESEIVLTSSEVNFSIDNTEGVWHVNFIMLDQAQNSSSYSTSFTTFTLDTLAPSAPAVIPNTTYTNASQVNFGLSGENGSTLFINGVSHGLMPSSTTLNLPSNSSKFLSIPTTGHGR